MLVQSGRAQEETACNLAFKAWVDPVFGQDGALAIPVPGPGGFCAPPIFGSAGGAFQQVNDQTQPFKTIQRAIDAIHYSLIAAYCASPNDYEGVVFALPGIYGEPAVGGQGEVFPIRMRDRVHVKGLHGRGCIIRGSNEQASTPTVFTIWPLLAPIVSGTPSGCAAGREDRVVLVDFSTSGEFKNALGIGVPDLPWAGTGNTAELLDGFTLQGGDVQVYFGQLIPYRWPLRGRITNCLFDMRHDPVSVPSPSTVRGPWMGILMGKEFEKKGGNCPGAPGVVGYFDQKVLIANNTFLMAECRPGPEWVNTARLEAVGIIDVTAPGSWVDIDNRNRGVGNPIIANNLFRTAPYEFAPPMPFAMLGVDIMDTQTVSASPSMIAPTNVFASGRVGSDNGYFASIPVTSINQGAPSGAPWHEMFDCKTAACSGGFPECIAVFPCQPAVLPIPVLELYDGTVTGTIDPGFVGEWLAPQLGSPPSTVYNDWRIMPGSPLEDLGLIPEAAANGTSIQDPGCQEIQSFAFDHEGWGNPRVVGGRPDVGFDERHGLIVAGSFGNETISHNDPPAGIQPTATLGRAKRVFIMPANVASPVILHGNSAAPTSPVPTAWAYPPPSALSLPVIDATAQVDFKTKWVSFNNRCPAPTPWPTGGAVVPLPVFWASPAGFFLANGQFRRIDGIDNAGGLDPEGALIAPCNLPDAPRYFSLQAFQQSGVPWYSNLQFEYR